MKIIQKFFTLLFLSSGIALANHHAEATEQSGPPSNVEHLLQAADHLEAAGAKKHADSIRKHLKDQGHQSADEQGNTPETNQQTNTNLAACCLPNARTAALRAGVNKSTEKDEGDKAECEKCATNGESKTTCRNCEAMLEKLEQIELLLRQISNKLN